MDLLVLLKFQHLHHQPDLTWGYSIRFHIQTSDVCSRLADIDKDTIARVGLQARRLVFWCIFPLTLSLCSYRSKWFRFSLDIQKVHFALSHLISPTNHELRLLPIYISGDDPTFLSRHYRVIYHSLENYTTLLSSGYVHLVLLLARDTR